MNRHMRAIQSAYGKAPFFEYYADEIMEIYQGQTQKLFDLNMAFLTKCLELLELDIEVQLLDKTDTVVKTSLYDAKNAINPKKTISTDSGFKSINYFQVFGNNFVPNLSIIDLIFCEGPQAREYIRRSAEIE